MPEAFRVCVMVMVAIVMVFALLGEAKLLRMRSQGRILKQSVRRAYLDEREEDRTATPTPSPVPSAAARHMTPILTSVRVGLNLARLPRGRLD